MLKQRLDFRVSVLSLFVLFLMAALCSCMSLSAPSDAEQGIKAYLAGDTNKAIECLERARTSGQDSAQVRSYLRNCYLLKTQYFLKQDKFFKAVSYVNAAKDLSKDDEQFKNMYELIVDTFKAKKQMEKVQEGHQRKATAATTAMPTPGAVVAQVSLNKLQVKIEKVKEDIRHIRGSGFAPLVEDDLKHAEDNMALADSEVKAGTLDQAEQSALSASDQIEKIRQTIEQETEQKMKW